MGSVGIPDNQGANNNKWQVVLGTELPSSLKDWCGSVCHQNVKLPIATTKEHFEPVGQLEDASTRVNLVKARDMPFD